MQYGCYVETLQVVHGQWNVGITEYKFRFLLWNGSEETYNKNATMLLIA
jgi:hypothetical protein